MHGHIQSGTGCPDPQMKKYKNKRFLCNTGPAPLNDHRATKPAFNVGPSSARQRNIIFMLMAFPWRADDGPFIAEFRSSIPTPTKRKKSKENLFKFGPPLTKLSGSAYANNMNLDKAAHGTSLTRYYSVCFHNQK